MTDRDDIHGDPIAVDEFHGKHGTDVDGGGPPVAQMASTFGSSFVRDAEQAERIADDATLDADEPTVGAEDPNGPAG
ncbi:MAG TPA: hypothetical protein VFM03_07845 [Candidatus Limnocylindria bacterium]|jgi:hypothetical protein|nr:hypothetical protein [Candidatus Limnocylindria bacterium]